MRIICPNCDAQYEVPNTVVPTEGRDVECSNCGKTWFQPHPDSPPEPPLVYDDDSVLVEHPSPIEAQPAEAAPSPRRREMDPDVAEILREEAEREKTVRSSETLEVQTDFNLPDGDHDATRRAREARERMAKMRGPDDTETADNAAAGLEPPEKAAIAAAASVVSSRRELLPDIEEINSTLRSAADRDAAGDDPSPQAPIRGRRKRGFRRGFVMAVALFSIAVLLYVFAPQIADALPPVDPWLSAYVQWVDVTRVWLDGKLQTVLVWLDAKAAASEQ